jgi:peroxiredoxin
MTTLAELNRAAEYEWLERWSCGPIEGTSAGLPVGSDAPDLPLRDETGRLRQLSEFWADQPALIMFWRHFGCSCGIQRAQRLRSEWTGYVAAGMRPLIVAPGEPSRAAIYREEYDLPCPVLCDPDYEAYRTYGIGHWAVEQVLYDAPSEMWSHARVVGERFQAARRQLGRAPVDDPWRATGEFVIQSGGAVRLAFLYQYCEDFPEPAVLTTAAQLSQSAWRVPEVTRP